MREKEKKNNYINDKLSEKIQKTKKNTHITQISKKTKNYCKYTFQVQTYVR